MDAGDKLLRRHFSGQSNLRPLDPADEVRALGLLDVFEQLDPERRARRQAALEMAAKGSDQK